MSTIGQSELAPHSIPLSEFRANCSRILDQVEEDGNPVTVTKNGRPVAVVTPFPKQPTSFWERLGEIINVEPDADIDNIWEGEWDADWCPTHEVIRWPKPAFLSSQGNSVTSRPKPSKHSSGAATSDKNSPAPAHPR